MEPILRGQLNKTLTILKAIGGFYDVRQWITEKMKEDGVTCDKIEGGYDNRRTLRDAFDESHKKMEEGSWG